MLHEIEDSLSLCTLALFVKNLMPYFIFILLRSGYFISFEGFFGLFVYECPLWYPTGFFDVQVIFYKENCCILCNFFPFIHLFCEFTMHARSNMREVMCEVWFATKVNAFHLLLHFSD